MRENPIDYEIEQIQQQMVKWRTNSHSIDPACDSLLEEITLQVSRAIADFLVAYKELERINADLIRAQSIAGLEHERTRIGLRTLLTDS